MVATSSPSNTLTPKSLLNICQGLLPGVAFVPGKTFFWSPRSKSVHFDRADMKTRPGQWAFLHEVAHAQLHHNSYNTDAALLALEVEAWQTANKTAEKIGLLIDPEHIEDCLDTYRDWLYARSTCPTCSLNSVQVDEVTYCCLNCSTRWSVSHSRFCRPYRMKLKHAKTPPELPQTVFS